MESRDFPRLEDESHDHMTAAREEIILPSQVWNKDVAISPQAPHQYLGIVGGKFCPANKM